MSNGNGDANGNGLRKAVASALALFTFGLLMAAAGWVVFGRNSLNREGWFFLLGALGLCTYALTYLLGVSPWPDLFTAMGRDEHAHSQTPAPRPPPEGWHGSDTGAQS